MIAVDLTGTVKILAPLSLLSVLDQRNTKVIRGKAFEAFRILEFSQNMRGFGIPAVGHEDLSAQEIQIVVNFRRNGPADALHGIPGIVRLVFLEVDPRQAENAFVADWFLDVALDDR